MIEQLLAEELASGYVAGPVSTDPKVGWQALFTVDECQAAITIIQGWLLIPIDQWAFAETQQHRDTRLNNRITLLQNFITFISGGV